jgi:methylated-DNA-[protein]-cysteine S-methyltransferase
MTCRAKFTDFGLCSLYWGFPKAALSPSLSDRAKQLRNELNEYFEGKRKEFTLPLDLEGVTDFQYKVFEQLLLIPHGETASYGDVAKRVGKPKGAQAVGQTVKRNPIGIIIPCHRVIASDGTIGGFGGGKTKEKLDSKRYLLSIEGVTIP